MPLRSPPLPPFAEPLVFDSSVRVFQRFRFPDQDISRHDRFSDSVFIVPLQQTNVLEHGRRYNETFIRLWRFMLVWSHIKVSCCDSLETIEWRGNRLVRRLRVDDLETIFVVRYYHTHYLVCQGSTSGVSQNALNNLHYNGMSTFRRDQKEKRYYRSDGCTIVLELLISGIGWDDSHSAGIEPTTFHRQHCKMRSENHTPRPRAHVFTSTHFIYIQCKVYRAKHLLLFKDQG